MAQWCVWWGIFAVIFVGSNAQRICTESQTRYVVQSYPQQYTYRTCSWLVFCSRRTAYRTGYRKVSETYQADVCCPGYSSFPTCNPECHWGCNGRGTCSSPGECDCREGWRGSRCQTAVCPLGCNGRGSCASPGVCACSATGWTGNQCQIARCSQGCNSRGSCIRPNFCQCLPGWSGNQCERDVNECNTNNGGCDHSCTNTLGSFECSCNEGYTLGVNQRSCTDINECNTNNGGCDHSCTNSLGSFECSCNEGYTLGVDQRTCTDVNECNTNNGDCGHNCTNTLGSFECSCNEGYTLDTNQRNCTKLPPACRNLQVLESQTRAGSITVMWERPNITKNDNYYYEIHRSDPDAPGNFIQRNDDPPLMQYTASGLHPHTNYTITVNGVSDQGPSGEEENHCEVTATTGDINPEAPRSVTSFCTVVVWQAPRRAYGAITGYDIAFLSSGVGGTEELTVTTKKGDELFHRVEERDWIGNSSDQQQGGQVFVRVRAKLNSADGIWSELVSLNCAS